MIKKNSVAAVVFFAVSLAFDISTCIDLSELQGQVKNVERTSIRTFYQLNQQNDSDWATAVFRETVSGLFLLAEDLSIYEKRQSAEATTLTRADPIPLCQSTTH